MKSADKKKQKIEIEKSETMKWVVRRIAILLQQLAKSCNGN